MLDFIEPSIGRKPENKQFLNYFRIDIAIGSEVVFNNQDIGEHDRYYDRKKIHFFKYFRDLKTRREVLENQVCSLQEQIRETHL